MVLLPLMQFIFDSNWADAVYMTAAKVWGPLAIGLLIYAFFGSWQIAAGALVVTLIRIWIDPKFYEGVKWQGVRDNG